MRRFPARRAIRRFRKHGQLTLNAPHESINPCPACESNLEAVTICQNCRCVHVHPCNCDITLEQLSSVFDRYQ